MAAATGRFYSMNFRDGTEIHDEQKLALGQLGLDDRGNVWSYVEFSGAVGVGDWVADTTGPLGAANLANDIEAGQRYFDVPYASGAHVIKDDLVFEGAYGRVTAGGSAGDIFFVSALEDIPAQNKQRVHVKMLGNGSGRRDADAGWTADFNGTTAIVLEYVGRVAQGEVATRGLARGVAQVAVSANEASGLGRRGFGWVQQTGIGLVDKAGGGGGIPLTLEASGKMAAAAVVVTDILGGRSLAGAAAAGLRLADIDIRNTASRMFGPVKRPVGYGQPALR